MFVYMYGNVRNKVMCPGINYCSLLVASVIWSYSAAKTSLPHGTLMTGAWHFVIAPKLCLGRLVEEQVRGGR